MQQSMKSCADWVKKSFLSVSARFFIMTSAISVQSVRLLMYCGFRGLQRSEYLGSLKFTTQNIGRFIPRRS